VVHRVAQSNLVPIAVALVGPALSVLGFQLTTDGLNTYPGSVEYNPGARVDYAQLIKEFDAEGGAKQRRYAPPRLIGTEKIVVAGDPGQDPQDHKTIHMTPAMAAGLARRPWSVGDLLREATTH
jgi:hypothetical protein